MGQLLEILKVGVHHIVGHRHHGIAPRVGVEIERLAVVSGQTRPNGVGRLEQTRKLVEPPVEQERAKPVVTLHLRRLDVLGQCLGGQQQEMHALTDGTHAPRTAHQGITEEPVPQPASLGQGVDAQHRQGGVGLERLPAHLQGIAVLALRDEDLSAGTVVEELIRIAHPPHDKHHGQESQHVGPQQPGEERIVGTLLLVGLQLVRQPQPKCRQ